MPERRTHSAAGMTDMLTYDFIDETPDERPARPVAREATGWEAVIFELEDDG